LACSLALSPLFLGKRSSLTLIYLRGYLRFAAAISCFFNLKRSGCAAVKKALIKSSDTHTLINRWHAHSHQKKKLEKRQQDKVFRSNRSRSRKRLVCWLQIKIVNYSKGHNNNAGVESNFAVVRVLVTPVHVCAREKKVQ